jgi:ribosomal protein L19
MANEPRSEWMRQLEKKRRELLKAYLNEKFERGDEVKKVVELMERHAASRGWREDKKT